jgi:hypothetical protein
MRDASDEQREFDRAHRAERGGQIVTTERGLYGAAEGRGPLDNEEEAQWDENLLDVSNKTDTTDPFSMEGVQILENAHCFRELPVSVFLRERLLISGITTSAMAFNRLWFRLPRCSPL